MFKNIIKLSINKNATSSIINQSSSLLSFRNYTSKVAQYRLLKGFREEDENNKKQERPNKLFTLNTLSPLQYPVEPITSDVVFAPKKSTTELKYPSIPFIVNRTASGKLPIYSELLRGHGVQYTILKNYRGDTNALLSELKNIFGDSTTIRQRQSTIEIKGNHSRTLLVWLTGLGF